MTVFPLPTSTRGQVIMAATHVVYLIEIALAGVVELSLRVFRP